MHPSWCARERLHILINIKHTKLGRNKKYLQVLGNARGPSERSVREPTEHVSFDIESFHIQGIE